MAATALSLLLAFSFVLQNAGVDEDLALAPPLLAEAAPAPEPSAVAPPDDDESARAHDDRAEDGSADPDSEQERARADEEPERGPRLGAGIGAASACAAADVVVGAVFGACGLCLLVSSQDGSLGQSVGQACSLFLGCPASLAVGVLPPLAALAGGCVGALFDDADVWGAVLGALPGVLVGVGGLALIVTGLALGMQTEGQGRDILAPWPLAPGSPPTAPDSLAYSAGLGVALLAGPLAVIGAAIGALGPDEDDDHERHSAARHPAEAQLAGGSPPPDGSMGF